MKIDTKGLAQLIAEANALTNKKEWTKQDERRNAYLLSAISAVKAGASLDDLQLEEVNETFRLAGLPQVNITKKVSETRAKAEAWSLAIKVAAEKRAANETEGNILARIGTYTGLGEFVPTEFIAETYTAMAAHDAFLDEDAVSMLNTTNGRVITVPTLGDIENVAQVIGESTSNTSSQANIAAPGHASVAAYSYRSPLWPLSIEAAQDVEAMGGYVKLFKKFAADRIARGAARDLVNGNGSGKPLGIIPALLAAGVTPQVATGSAENTGGSETGVNSIGTIDIAKLYYSVDKAYRNSPKAAFFMSDDTLVSLAQLVNKMGEPIVKWQGPEAFIFGKPVRISPSMDSIAAGNYPILFGDGSYWLSRNVVDNSGDESLTYVRIVKEAPGLIEKGNVALQMFCRWDGVLLWNDAGSPAPFAILQNHT